MTDLFDGYLICRSCGFRSGRISLQQLSLFGDGKFLFQHTGTGELRYIVVLREELGIKQEDDDDTIFKKRDSMEQKLRRPEEVPVKLKYDSDSIGSTAFCPDCGAMLEFG